jgi:hypothetical protein
MRKIKAILLSLLCIFCSSCTQKIEDYKESKIKADLRQAFNGKLKGWGLYFDFFGIQKSSFTLDMDGKWNGNQGVIDEIFYFDNGDKLNRQWRINYLNDNSFTAESEDVVGNASGNQAGNVVNTLYQLIVPYKDSNINLSASDWIYKIDDESVFSEIFLYKFGIKVGRFVIFMKKA